MGRGSAMEQGYAGCFKGVGGVFFFSSGVVSGIVQYTIFCFVLLDDHCFIIVLCEKKKTLIPCWNYTPTHY